MKKGLIITAIILTVLGLTIIAGAFFVSGGDLSKFIMGKYETNTYTVDGKFTAISIVSREADVVFKPSENGKARVVCTEREKVPHVVKVENGTLFITEDDRREWYDYITFFRKSLSMTVYLPDKEYASLELESSTGDVDVPDVFSFGSAHVEASTGDVTFGASVEELLGIKTSTGNIELDKLSAGQIALEVSTGNIRAASVECAGAINAHVSTGRITMSDVTCDSFKSTGSTGDVDMTSVIASGRFDIDRSTGDIHFENCDAGEIRVETSTGDVTGTLLSAKVFITHSSTGRIAVPDSATGGRCEITTSTGDIEITIKER